MRAVRERDEQCTKDGTVNYHNHPAVKSATGTWKACPYILGNECCERLAFYGINTNLVNYLKDQLNQSSVVAVNNVTNWSGTCYVTPLLGAFLADAYLGRYWTIAAFSIIYVFGMTLLTLSASVHGLKPRCTENNICHPTMVQSGVFFVGLYLIALGTGGIKPCVSSFGADQFDDSDDAEKKHKSSFFNWFYFSINIGALVAASALVAAATLELVRLNQVKKHSYYELKHMPMSIMWQVPQYLIIGCAEVFTFVGQLEFFYEQAPDAMRSLCSALSLATVALGNYLSSMLVNVVTEVSTKGGRHGWIPDNLNYGHVHYFFGLLGGLSVVNLGCYVMVARRYTYKRPIEVAK